ncbi:MAG: hypothetical protein J5586_00035 [Clostridia bacterium]|nr:hypothetical protein [Clostridia bacterium]
MKYNPTKKYEFTVPAAAARVMSLLTECAADKKRAKDDQGPAKQFFGKLKEGGFSLTPNTGVCGGYVPTVAGELTEVTESKSSPDGSGVLSNTFTRVDMDMQLLPRCKMFSFLWLALSAAALGLSLWLCFKKGFDGNWWTLLIGPAMFLIERAVCNIGFRANARKVCKLIKSALKN